MEKEGKKGTARVVKERKSPRKKAKSLEAMTLLRGQKERGTIREIEGRLLGFEKRSWHEKRRRAAEHSGSFLKSCGS